MILFEAFHLLGLQHSAKIHKSLIGIEREVVCACFFISPSPRPLSIQQWHECLPNETLALSADIVEKYNQLDVLFLNSPPTMCTL